MGSSHSKLATPDEATISLWQLLLHSITKPTTPAKVTTMLAAGAEVYGRPSSIPASQSKTMLQHAQDSLLRQHGREAEVVRTVEAVIRLLKDHVDASLRQAVQAGDDKKFGLLSQPAVGGDLSQPSCSPFGLLGLAVQSPSVSASILSSLLAVPANQSWILTTLPDGSSLYSRSTGAARAVILNEINSQLCTLPKVQRNDAASEALLKRFRELGIPVNLHWKDADGNTLLHHSAVAHQATLVRYLLSEAVGVDSQVTNNAGKTALMLLQAQSNASPEMIRLLGVVQENNRLARLIKQEGANVTLEAMNALITRGAEVNSKDGGRRSMPLHLLVQDGVPTAVVEKFIDQHRADMEAFDQNGMRAVELALLRDENTTTLDMLLDKGAKLYNSAVKCTLFSLAERNSRPKAAAIIRARASLSLWQALQSCTPQSATEAQLTAVRDMFALGADPCYIHKDEEYKQGITLLAFVSINGHVSVVDEMVRVCKLVDVAFAGSDDTTALLAAASAGRLDMLQYYKLRLNRMLGDQNAEGESALHLATKGRHLYVVQWLIDNGVDVNLKTKSGQTALDMAIQPSTSSQQYQNAVSQGWNDVQQLALVTKLRAVDYASTFGTTTEDTLVRSMAPPPPNDVRADEGMPAQQPSAPDLPPVEEINEGTERSLRFRLDAWRNANARLRSSAEKGNLEDVKKQIGDEKADIRALDDRGKSAYSLALESAVKADSQAQLIQLRDPNAANIQRQNAVKCREVAQYLATIALVGLRDAIIKQNAAAVRSFLELGASPAKPDLIALCVINAQANPTSPTAAPAILRRLLELVPSHLAMLTTRQSDTGMTLVPDYCAEQPSCASHIHPQPTVSPARNRSGCQQPGECTSAAGCRGSGRHRMRR